MISLLCGKIWRGRVILVHMKTFNVYLNVVNHAISTEIFLEIRPLQGRKIKSHPALGLPSMSAKYLLYRMLQNVVDFSMMPSPHLALAANFYPFFPLLLHRLHSCFPNLEYLLYIEKSPKEDKELKLQPSPWLSCFWWWSKR